MKIFERTTGINCVELLKDGITKMMEFWWMAYDRQNQRLESSHRFFIDLLIWIQEEGLNVCVGEKREYVGEIVDGKRLTSQNDYHWLYFHVPFRLKQSKFNRKMK